MKMIKKALLMTTLVSISLVAHAEEYWVADIRVKSVKAVTQGASKFTCNTIIESSNDDDARDAEAIIMFSPEVRYTSFRITNLNLKRFPRTKNDGRGAVCRVSRATGRLSGFSRNGQSSYLKCSLGHLSTQAKLQLKVSGVLTRRTKFKPNCSALVLSSTPDPSPGNNYMVGR